MSEATLCYFLSVFLSYATYSSLPVAIRKLVPANTQPLAVLVDVKND